LNFCHTSVSRCGNSARQGPHQVAKKFTTITFPLSFSVENCRPSVVVTSIEGAASPTLTNVVSASPAVSGLAAGATLGGELGVVGSAPGAPPANTKAVVAIVSSVFMTCGFVRV